MQRLEVIEGRAEPGVVAVTDEVLIGRTHHAALRVFDDTASRQHAAVRVGGLRTVLVDLDSANGTWLNGARVRGEAALFDGDEIRIGSVRLRFRTTDGAERETVAEEDAEVRASVDPEAVDPAREAAHERAAARLRLVCDAALCAADAPTAAALAATLLERLAEAFAPDRATVVVRGAGGVPRVLAARPPGSPVPASRTIARRVLEQGEALWVGAGGTAGGAGAGDPAGRSIVAGRFRSALAAPLKAGAEVLGMLCLEAERPDAYERADLDALAAVARQAALALRNLHGLDVARAELGRLARHARGARAGADAPPILGEHPRMEALRERLGRAAASDAPVLVTGETGTGKELVARHLHAQAPRRAEPFVALNCAALVEGLLESEFFGHEQGAFSGAVERREGRIVQAGRGTLFLDEVGDLSPTLQAKLLRVLSEGTFTRVGGTETLTLGCRVVAATHRDLLALVKQGAFREDLYYRLAVVTLEVPPLRARGDDVLLLAEVALERLAARLGRRVPRLTDDARERLRAYGWPGNVRELFNVLERVLVLLDGETVGGADLRLGDAPGAAGVAAAPGAAPEGEVLTLREAEARAVRAALAATGGRKGAAAQLLGVSWPTLNRKIREYGVEVPRGAG